MRSPVSFRHNPVTAAPAILLAALTIACGSQPAESTKDNDTASNEAEEEPVEQKPVRVLLFDAVHISSDEDSDYFQSATTEIDFGTESVRRARLLVELESPCFPFDKWTRAGIPEGHVWPEYCDAFDRTVELSLDGSEPPDPERPGLELGRAITPFGGPLELEFDVTDVVNGLGGKHELRLKIPTWPDPEGQVSGAKGEWIASVWLELQPGDPPRRVLAVVPLAYQVQTEATVPEVAFETPEETSRAHIDYRVTGHGGGAFRRNCFGPAEEFCRRTHSLSLDGEEVSELVPWRSDCDSLCTMEHYESSLLSIDYCAENPCGAPESVRAPRANWCPGSSVDTYVVEQPALTEPGPHAFSWAISDVAEEGSWLVSATYYAFE